MPPRAKCNSANAIIIEPRILQKRDADAVTLSTLPSVSRSRYPSVTWKRTDRRPQSRHNPHFKPVTVMELPKRQQRTPMPEKSAPPILLESDAPWDVEAILQTCTQELGSAISATSNGEEQGLVDLEHALKRVGELLVGVRLALLLRLQREARHGRQYLKSEEADILEEVFFRVKRHQPVWHCCCPSICRTSFFDSGRGKQNEAHMRAANDTRRSVAAHERTARLLIARHEVHAHMRRFARELLGRWREGHDDVITRLRAGLGRGRRRCLEALLLLDAAEPALVGQQATSGACRGGSSGRLSNTDNTEMSQCCCRCHIECDRGGSGGGGGGLRTSGGSRRSDGGDYDSIRNGGDFEHASEEASLGRRSGRCTYRFSADNGGSRAVVAPAPPEVSWAAATTPSAVRAATTASGTAAAAAAAPAASLPAKACSDEFSVERLERDIQDLMAVP
ncbi:unnamed protein product [Phaeothamnion confervicola]